MLKLMNEGSLTIGHSDFNKVERKLASQQLAVCQVVVIKDVRCVKVFRSQHTYSNNK